MAVYGTNVPPNRSTASASRFASAQGAGSCQLGCNPSAASRSSLYQYKDCQSPRWSEEWPDQWRLRPTEIWV